MNTILKENIKCCNGGPDTLVERCHGYRSMALDLENRVRTLKQNDEITRGVPGEPFDTGECVANIMLAIRHLEDARMRLGKVIQARDGGVSCYHSALPGVVGAAYSKEQVGRHLRRDTAEYKQRCLPSVNEMKSGLAVESITGIGGTEERIEQQHNVSAEVEHSQIAEKFAQINAELKAHTIKAIKAIEADIKHGCSYCYDGAVTTPCGHCNGGAK